MVQNLRRELFELWRGKVLGLLNKINKSVKHNLSSEATSSSGSQGIHSILGNPAIYSMLTTTRHLLIMSQINPVQALSSYFLNISFNIIFPLTSSSSKCYLSFRFLTKILYAPLLRPVHASCPTKLIHLHFFAWCTGHDTLYCTTFSRPLLTSRTYVLPVMWRTGLASLWKQGKNYISYSQKQDNRLRTEQ